MNEYDDRIRRALDAQARRVQADPDPTDLTDRISRRERRRTRALSAALVLTLFAGPTLGFIAARGDGGKGDNVDTADDGSGGGGGDGVTLASPGALPTLRPESTSGFGNSASLGAPPRTEVSEAPANDVSKGIIMSQLGGMTNEPLARVFVRDHAGMKIRVYRADVDQPTGAGPPWWTAPGYCFPNGYVQADVSNDDMVGLGYGNIYSELEQGVVGGTLTAIGVSEGSAQWVVVAQAPAGAAKVRATFPGGATDEMEPVDGVAVLVGPANIAPDDQSFYDERAQLEAFDGSGASLGTGDAAFGGSRVTLEGTLDFNADACSAPQELPAPGPEQPADVAAARQAVTDAFALAHGTHDETQEQMMSAIDDPTNFPDYWNQLATGTFKDQVNAAVVGLDDVVFESATRAAIKYHWDVPNYGTSFYNRFGEVTLVDGTWKVTRESMCQDFALAGTYCS